MVYVTLTGNFVHVTGGVAKTEVEARNIRQLFQALSEQFPALEPHLKEGAAVALDGVIYQDSWFEAIPDGSEVHLMPAIGGG